MASRRTASLEMTVQALRSRVMAAEPRRVRARLAAEVIRKAGGYRWVGLYDVKSTEIAVIGWSGPAAPTHPRFPRSQGLNGVSVDSRRPVVVKDVRKDPRYLPTLDDTRSEMIIPVCCRSGAVVGTIDVESDEVDAFTDRDDALLNACAVALGRLWKGRRKA